MICEINLKLWVAHILSYHTWVFCITNISIQQFTLKISVENFTRLSLEQVRWLRRPHLLQMPANSTIVSVKYCILIILFKSILITKFVFVNNYNIFYHLGHSTLGICVQPSLCLYNTSPPGVPCPTNRIFCRPTVTSILTQSSVNHNKSSVHNWVQVTGTYLHTGRLLHQLFWAKPYQSLICMTLTQWQWNACIR